MNNKDDKFVPMHLFYDAIILPSLFMFKFFYTINSDDNYIFFNQALFYHIL